MNLTHLSIGQMAKLNGISEQTLRLYDKMGLLHPNHIDSQTGYRYYSIGQSATLDMIQYYKEIGISLKEIHEKLNEWNINSMPSILQLRYEYIQNEIEKLKINRQAIIRTIDNFNRYLSSPNVGEIFLEYIPERKIYVYKTEANLFSYSYDNYEYYLRTFKAHLLSIPFHINYFCNVGTIVRNHYLLKNELYSDEMFIYVDDPSNRLPYTELIPAGTYLSMCCKEFTKEKEYLETMLNELNKSNREVIGDYFCEVVAEYPNAKDGQREIFYKIQIKIR